MENKNVKKTTKTITRKSVKNNKYTFKYLYIVVFVLSLLACVNVSYTYMAYLYLASILNIITPFYLYAECAADTKIKNKNTKICINLFDYILGALLLWMPHVFAVRIYSVSSYLYGIMGIIFCAIPFIKNKLAKAKLDEIKWIRIITRILILVAIILVLEACSNSGGIA